MSATVSTVKDEKLAEVAAAARAYFEQRDELEEVKKGLLEAILDASEEGGATQQEIADRCDLRDSDATDQWQFHRTRIQQFLREARRS